MDANAARSGIAVPPDVQGHPPCHDDGARGYKSLLREAFVAWSAHRASSMGAALAFYAAFSIAPILVIAIAVAGSVFGPEAARGEVIAQFGGLIGSGGAETMQSLLASAYRSDLGFWASVIASITLLVAATTVFAELKDSLDVIWGRKSPSRSGIMEIVLARLLSFGLILTMGFLLLVSLVASAALVVLQKYWGGAFGNMGWLLESLNSVFSFGVVFVLFACIYKWLPDPRIAWRDVVVGAAFTAALFTMGKFLIGLYLGNSQIASGFGAAGSLVMILLWVYYSSQIFFIGAEITHVCAERSGSI
jgi:membrane protein